MDEEFDSFNYFIRELDRAFLETKHQELNRDRDMKTTKSKSNKGKK